MPAFDFKGLDKSGKEVSGVRDADNEKALRALLKAEGVFITRIGKGPRKGQSLLATEVDIAQYFERINASDIAIFTRQLATLSKAGIPLLEAISATVDQSEKPKLRKVLAQLRQDVSEGASLAAALQKHPKVFSPIFPNMIRAGEASGTLDTVLLRLAEFTENSVKLRQKIQSAMMYPVVMVGFGGLILAGMFAYVIPQISQIFIDTGQDLPVLTQIVIGFSDLLRNYWWLGFILFIVTIHFFLKWKKTETGIVKWDRQKLRFPIFGKIVLMIAVSRFTNTLATLLRSGVPLLTSLDITKNVMANEILSQAIEEARIVVKEGGNLADPLKRCGHFPPIVTHLVAIGERSGALDEMLTVVSDAYETQVENRISTLTSLLEPFMIAVSLAQPLGPPRLVHAPRELRERGHK